MAGMHIHKTVTQEGVFKQMFDCLPHAIALTNDAGIIQYTNEAFDKLTGCENNGFRLRPIEDLFVTKSQPATSLVTNFHSSGRSSLEFTDRMLMVKGQKIRLKLTLSRSNPGICFTLLPINVSESLNRHEDLHQLYTTLTEKNTELVAANQELSRSNQELSQYAYVASHDLQEPLRKIRIFSDILMGNMQLSPKDRFIAHKINKASERMGFLIRDLLTYSKLLKPDLVAEKVNLNEILRAVMSDFEMTIQEKKAMIHFDELPVIHAVHLQMNQLFYNLLSNGLKFTLPGQAPHINICGSEISYEEVHRRFPQAASGHCYLKIVFKDNGIGFDKKNSEKIFEVFQRLTTKDKYQGSGIGLALCRRIVQNHGGLMYADSEPGKGSSFNIILPMSKTG